MSCISVISMIEVVECWYFYGVVLIVVQTKRVTRSCLFYAIVLLYYGDQDYHIASDGTTLQNQITSMEERPNYKIQCTAFNTTQLACKKSRCSVNIFCIIVSDSSSQYRQKDDQEMKQIQRRLCFGKLRPERKRWCLKGMMYVLLYFVMYCHVLYFCCCW